jgi:hypothetical protein
MAIIEALVLAVAAIAIAVVLVLIVVITGIHQEERRGTIARENPPSGLARLTRRMLGAHFCLGAEGQLATVGAMASHTLALADFETAVFQAAAVENPDQARKAVLAG